MFVTLATPPMTTTKIRYCRANSIVLSLAPSRRSSGSMNSRHSREKARAARTETDSVQEAALFASSGSFRPSSRTTRLPPPTPNRLPSAPAIRKTVSTREEAATI